MQRFLAILGHWLHGMAFAAWFGGILVVGGIVAPAAFDTDRRLAGLVIGESFRKLNLLSLVCGGVMLAATWAQWQVRGDRARRLLFVRTALTAAALAMSLYLTLRLFPVMIGLRAAGQMGAFDRLHQLYTMVTQTQLLLLAIGSLLSAVVAVPRRTLAGTGEQSRARAVSSPEDHPRSEARLPDGGQPNRPGAPADSARSPGDPPAAVPHPPGAKRP
jgi:hypothetical protein